jgi:FAD:protein FMN transferase
VSPRPPDDEYVFRHHPLLGTVVDVRVGGMPATEARRVSDRVVADMVRLEAVFSRFDPSSELRRWVLGEVDDPSGEFVELMSISVDWQRRSDGAFNPLAGELSACWRHAVESGRVPLPEQLSEVAAAIRAPGFEVRDGRIHRLGDCSGLDLNAIAKGYIVDTAMASAVAEFDPPMILVGAGGDVLQRGTRGSLVHVENPLRPYDNEPAIATVAVHDAALATSGGSRRGYRIGDRWFSHVIDPRTGATVEHLASISVLAPDATTADVVATIAGTMAPPDAVAYVESLGDVGCFVVDRVGDRWSSARWRSAQESAAVIEG